MFTNLVLSGGAIKGFSFIGVIRLLEEKELLKGIKTYVGASAGSIICFLLALGYTSDNIYMICLELYSSYINKAVSIDSILNMDRSLGIDSGYELTQYLRHCLHEKYAVESMTFIDLSKKSGINLVVCASNISKGESTFFSVDATPQVCVIDAIRASITIPLVFTPIEIEGHLYVDASIYNNFPVDYVKNFVLKDTLGVIIKSRKFRPKPPLHLIQYMRLIIETMLEIINVKNKWLDRIALIEIDESEEEIFDIDMNTMKLVGGENNLKKYYLKGYESADEKINEIERMRKCFIGSEPSDDVFNSYSHTEFNASLSTLLSGTI